MKKIFGKIAMLRRLKVFLNESTLNTIYKSMIQPHFDYCSLTWYGRYNDDSHKLDVLQKRVCTVNSWC